MEQACEHKARDTRGLFRTHRGFGRVHVHLTTLDFLPLSRPVPSVYTPLPSMRAFLSSVSLHGSLGVSCGEFISALGRLDSWLTLSVLETA
jgi:hypothetical protein